MEKQHQGIPWVPYSELQAEEAAPGVNLFLPNFPG